MSNELVLVTGAAGHVGKAVVAELARRGRAPRGFDRVPHAELTDQIVGDLVDTDAVAKAMRGVHTLIHLAATPDDDDFMSRLLPGNIVGVYNVLEAARDAGVRRVIVASSIQVVWYQRMSGPFPITVDTPPTPRYWYAATKLFLEGAARAFVEKHHIPALVVRIAWCPRSAEQVAEIAANPRHQDSYLSPGDAGRFFACAVEAKWSFNFAVAYAASRHLRQPFYDLETSRRLIGYEPQEEWPAGIEGVMEKSSRGP